MPSLGSLAGSLVLVLAIVGFHLLLLSNQADLFLPHVAGGTSDQLAEIYTSNILGPLNNLFGNSTFGVVSTALVWGLAGWIVYALLDFAVNSWQDWRRSDSDINVPRSGKVVRHPMHSQVVIRVLWRFLLGVIAIAVLIALQPIISNLFSHDIEFLKADSGSEMFKHIGIVIASWLAILHGYVVLFRFFVFRTRVFGEILY